MANENYDPVNRRESGGAKKHVTNDTNKSWAEISIGEIIRRYSGNN
jgi:hypothetical protein